MKNRLILIISLVLMALIMMSYVSRKSDSRLNATGSAQERTTATVVEENGKLAPQRRTMGAVEVQVTPVRLEANAQPVLNIELNTHSVELDYDLTQVMQLTDDLGNSYKPLVWSGGSGGHHLTGELLFENLKSEAQTLSLTLSEIDGQTAEFMFKIGGEKK